MNDEALMSREERGGKEKEKENPRPLFGTGKSFKLDDDDSICVL